MFRLCSREDLSDHLPLFAGWQPEVKKKKKGFSEYSNCSALKRITYFTLYSLRVAFKFFKPRWPFPFFFFFVKIDLPSDCSKQMGEDIWKDNNKLVSEHSLRSQTKPGCEGQEVSPNTISASCSSRPKLCLCHPFARDRLFLGQVHLPGHEATTAGGNGF